MNHCQFCGRKLETDEQQEAQYCDARCKVGAMAQWV
jgi:predicted nucleic acid-binding Zn ribbon protein